MKNRRYGIALVTLAAMLALAGCRTGDTGASATAGQAMETSGSTPEAAAGAESGGAQATSGDTAAAEQTPAGKEVVLADGLRYTDEVIGDGPIAEKGSSVSVHYTGWLTDGTKFDSSRDRGTPFQFRLGAGQVIRGWDEGVEGMRVGGKRKLTIPPALGYGAAGAGGVIPPNATLVFEVELLGVQ